MLLRVDYGNDEVDDVARGAELPRRSLGAQVLQQHFVGVADFLGIGGVKAVDGAQEIAQNDVVVVGDVGVLVDGADGRHNVGLAQQGHAVPVQTVHVVCGPFRAHQAVPATFGVLAGEVTRFAFQGCAGSVLGAEELVNQGPGDFLALVHRQGHLAHQQVAGGVDDVFDFLDFHGFITAISSRIRIFKIMGFSGLLPSRRQRIQSCQSRNPTNPDSDIPRQMRSLQSRKS